MTDTTPFIQGSLNARGEEFRQDGDEDSDYELEGDQTNRTFQGKVLKLKRAAHRTLKEWRRHPMRVLKRNIFLLTLLFFMTCSQLLVKTVSLKIQNLEGSAFALGQAQPIVAMISFGIAWVISLLWTAYKLHKRRKEDPDLDESDYHYNYSVSKWHLAVVGTFLSIGNVFLFMGSGSKSVPGPVSVLLQQMVIPATLFIAIFWFRTRFFAAHYIGALIILLGIGITVIPPKTTTHALMAFMDDVSGSGSGSHSLSDTGSMSDSGSLHHSGSGSVNCGASGTASTSSGTVAWAVLCILAAAIANAFGMAFLEYRVMAVEKNLNLAWLWMWINAFEIFSTIPMLPIVAPLQHPRIPYSNLLKDLGNGYACIFGNHSPEDNPCIDCSGTIQLYIPLILMFVLSRLNIAYVIQIGSAALMWFVAAATLPIASIFFTFHFVSGPTPPKLTGTIIGGLILVMVGLLTFRLSRDPQKNYYTDFVRSFKRLFWKCTGQDGGPNNNLLGDF